MRRSLRIWPVVLGVLCTVPTATAAAKSLDFDLTVHAKHDAERVPVTVPIQLTGDIRDSRSVEISTPGGDRMAAELTDSGLISATSPPSANRSVAAHLAEMHFVLPAIKAGETIQLHGAIRDSARDADASTGFHWHDVPYEHNLLSFGSRPVLDFMCRPLDESSKEAREETFKPFHHLYDPDGKILVTKGPGGYFTHHRGLFYGFNKITYGGKEADVWHCTKNCYQSSEKVLDEAAGPVLGRQIVAIDWHGQDRQPFAHEQREMTVYNLPGGTMIDFASRLETVGEKVRLDGDPQHSGFHFRTANEVADKGKVQKTKDGKTTAEKVNPETIFIRADGVGRPGEAINWDPKLGAKNDPRTINQPWKGMSFLLGGERYTVAMLDLPSNPKEARFSERDYGRFGSYFEYDLTKDHPLEIRYRVWLQKGMMTPEQIAALAADFAEPVEATIKLAAASQ
jgi:Methane oxygenase PmoA